MKVELVNFTPKPLETAFWAFKNMHNKVTGDIPDFENRGQKLKFLETLVEIPHQTVLEFVSTVWLTDGSRAFQQQLTRTRDAGYSIQSLRVCNVETFATDGNYHTPRMPEEIEKVYDEAMFQAQENYKKLISMGAPVEVARGVLPLNIESPITHVIDLRALVHQMELRLCKNAQEEYRNFAEVVYREIYIKIDPDFARIFFKPPCRKYGFCPSPVPCEMVPTKYESRIKHNPEDIGILG